MMLSLPIVNGRFEASTNTPRPSQTPDSITIGAEVYPCSRMTTLGPAS